MRKIVTLALLAMLALPAGGCASSAEGLLGLPSGVLTKSVANPVTKTDLYRIENGMLVVASGLRAYKKLCNNGSLPADCIKIVQDLQAGVHQSRPLIRQLRTFVRKNDQVNAAVVWNTLQGIIAQYRAEAAKAGVQLPQPQ